MITCISCSVFSTLFSTSASGSPMHSLILSTGRSASIRMQRTRSCLGVFVLDNCIDKWRQTWEQDCVQLRLLTERLHDILSALLAVSLVLHGASNVKICNKIPPNPGAVGLIGNSMHTKLSEILIDDVFAFIANSKILLWVWRTISAVVNALGLALAAKSEGLGAIPSDVVWCELSVTSLLQNLSMTLKTFNKIHLLITSSATFVIAVGPKLILHSVVWMGNRLSPV